MKKEYKWVVVIVAVAIIIGFASPKEACINVRYWYPIRDNAIYYFNTDRGEILMDCYKGDAIWYRLDRQRTYIKDTCIINTLWNEIDF